MNMQMTAFSSGKILVATMLAAVTLSLSAGCGFGNGPHVRFSTATEAQLKASESGPVWYEFHEGDEVPIAFLYKGVFEAGAPIRAKAKKKFWLVMQPNSPPRFSFDGKTISLDSGKAGILVAREKGENFVGVVIYVGDPSEAPPELRGK